MEIWKDVVGFEGYYKVSSHGRVKSCERVIKYATGREVRKKERIITPIWLDRKGGYYVVALIVNKKRHNLWLTHIMAKAFFGSSCIAQQRIEFVDKDRRNYHIKNLRLVNTTERNKKICKDYENGMTQPALARKYNLNQTHISKITRKSIPELHLPTDVDGEEWRPMEGFNGLYYISSHGRVFSYLKHGKSRATKRVWGVLTPQTNPKGYLALILRTEQGRKRNVIIHQEVAKVFCPGQAKGLVVDHINNDKLDNRASNLRWVTNAYNIQRSSKNAKHVTTVRRLAACGHNPDEISTMLGVNKKVVTDIITGKTYKGFESEE